MTQPNRLGYCCINLGLSASRIMTNRGMVKRTFKAKGLPYASQLALRNLQDLEKIIQWNVDNNIHLYRMSSSLFPWMSEYEMSDLPDYQAILTQCQKIGKLATMSNMRLTFHPGHFNVLASRRQDVVAKSIKELNQHSEIMDMMQLAQTHDSAINIHINLAKGDKCQIMRDFMDNFYKLTVGTQSRLVIENDDKPGQWSVKQLHEHMTMYGQLIPITFDYLHHQCHSDGLSVKEALELADTTWPVDVIQLCHYSSTRTLEVPDAMFRAHAHYIFEKIDCHGLTLDIELEAKAKELALKDYISNIQ